MRIGVSLSFLLLLTGCAVVPPSAWTFDAAQSRVATVVPAHEFAAWSERVANLQARRDEIRARIAGERDAWERQRQYERLHAVGMELTLLEDRLASAAPAR